MTEEISLTSEEELPDKIRVWEGEKEEKGVEPGW